MRITTLAALLLCASVLVAAAAAQPNPQCSCPKWVCPAPNGKDGLTRSRFVKPPDLLGPLQGWAWSSPPGYYTYHTGIKSWQACQKLCRDDVFNGCYAFTYNGASYQWCYLYNKARYVLEKPAIVPNGDKTVCGRARVKP